MLEIDVAAPFVLLEDSRPPAIAGHSHLFSQAKSVEVAADGDVRTALARLQHAADGGASVAGWLSYEAGLALEPKLHRLMPADVPLMWFGVFARHDVISADDMSAFWHSAPVTVPNIEIGAVCPIACRPRDYTAAVVQVLKYINAGDIYQANLTFQVSVAAGCHPLALYRYLRRAQPVAYAALVHEGESGWTLSFSPELFFELHGSALQTKPMKGTISRAPMLADDSARATTLRDDPKNRAENLMIVDLLRNDMARVCLAGSIAVPQLYAVETLPTVHQMTSTITGTLQPHLRPSDVIAALFPCGSITGAPKIRAMEIIAETEIASRGIYCGSIGYFSERDACFNVAIRTLVKTAGAPDYRLGIGAGIVADSVADDELAECLLKAKFLNARAAPFDLFETLLWTPADGFRHLAAHLARLAESAAYWQFSCNTAEIQRQLADFATALQCPSRVRIMLSRNGAVSCQAQPLQALATGPARLVISPNPMHSDNPFLFHKTTHRAFYDDTRRDLARATGCTECLFVNERNELTEGSFTTLFIRRNTMLLTPALACGLLPGILRQQMLESGQATEAVLTRDDLMTAEDIFIGNSVRGLMPARLMQPGAPAA